MTEGANSPDALYLNGLQSDLLYRVNYSRIYCPALLNATLHIILVSPVSAVSLDFRKFLKSNYQLRSQEIAPFCQ
jgi:hypothetical protein